MARNGSPLAALVVPEAGELGTPAHSLRSNGSPGTSGLDPVESRRQRAAFKRRTASEWMSHALGVTIPHDSDQAFRASLADGVLLCRLMNWLRPGSITKIVQGESTSVRSSLGPGEVMQTFENVSNFLAAAKTLSAETFSVHDLEAGDLEERPIVAECILSLRDVAAGRTPPGVRAPSPWHEATPGSSSYLPSPGPSRRASLAGGPTPATAPGSHVLWRSPSPMVGAVTPQPGAAGPGTVATPPPAPSFSFTPAAAQVVAKHGLTGNDAADGLNHLMRSCTHMLRSRMGLSPAAGGGGGDAAGDGNAAATNSMGPGLSSSSAVASQVVTSQAPGAGLSNGKGSNAAPTATTGNSAAAAAAAALPAFALDAVGPVLESVLSNLTSEYEKRLLAKDQEFKLAQEAQERLRRQLARFQAEQAEWRAQVEDLRREASAAVEAGAMQRQHKPGSSPTARSTAVDDAALAAARVELEHAAARAEEADARLTVAEAELEATRAMCGEREAESSALRIELTKFEGLRERYDALAAKNRQLYDAVQEARGALRVFCRVRPAGVTGDTGAPAVELGSEEGTLRVYSARNGGRVHDFRFDAVFGPESGQEHVYAGVAPLARSVLDGYDVCIFAYGQTGSGKTHTMSGGGGCIGGGGLGDHASGPGDPAAAVQDQRGVNDRTLDDLFALRDERRDEVRYDIRVQLLEIYNEALRDLLVEPGTTQPASLPLVSTARSGSNVPDAVQLPVTCAADVAEAMDRGQSNRAVAGTRMNERSSRSHCVLTVLVEGEWLGSGERTRSCLHLIDLAGSERVGRSGAEGAQLLEAQHINKSLSALGSVMHALAAKSAHVPYRDSKLTALLADSLANGAKTMMFVHVAPEASSVSETLSTLNFGKVVTEITLGAAKKNTAAAGPGGADAAALREAKEAAARAAADADSARQELHDERARANALEVELASLRDRLAMAELAASTVPSTAEEFSARPLARRSSVDAPEATTIPAHRPSSLPVATPPGNSTGRSLDRKGPLRPTGSSGAGGGAVTTATASAAAARGSSTAPVSKLNLSRLRESSETGSMHSARPSGRTAVAGSRIPGATPPPATARMARSPSMASSIPRPMSARGTPDAAGGRRASLGGMDTGAPVSRVLSRTSSTGSKETRLSARVKNGAELSRMPSARQQPVSRHWT